MTDHLAAALFLIATLLLIGMVWVVGLALDGLRGRR